MSASENNPEYIQPYESFTVDMLRDFAEAIIRHRCDDTAALTGTDRTSWDTPDASVHILKRATTHGPNYYFQIKDNTQLDSRLAFLISAHTNKVSSFDGDSNLIEGSDGENMKELMKFCAHKMKSPSHA